MSFDVVAKTKQTSSQKNCACKAWILPKSTLPLFLVRRPRYNEESYCPEKTNNTFEKESWANNGEKPDMPQNLFNDDEICTTCEGSSQATQI